MGRRRRRVLGYTGTFRDFVSVACRSEPFHSLRCFLVIAKPTFQSASSLPSWRR
eukprot:m.266464 g.266464  ORF g.266464 m.266464 type:complete len:54 (+) comp40500_c0_seq49:1-162(+)